MHRAPARPSPHPSLPARRRHRALGLGLSTLCLTTAMAVALPQRAQACGGTFCDSGPTPMPVEQTGETILFVMNQDQGTIEAHIQIVYDPETEAQQFAWVVPVTALPQFEIGSQQLFANLLAGTVPVYGLGIWNEPCGFGTFGEPGDGCDGGADESGGGLALDVGGGGGPPSEPDVVLATTVGAFEVFVLDGGTAEGVMTWLGDNGFEQDPDATPILEEYLAEGHLFVAFRLATDAEASEIHPIVLRYEGAEPCVPIRLTRIAAQEDLEIRAFFLGDFRVASSNYRQVELNPLKIDWMSTPVNYREAVTMAVDEADGHAFVTEYAGSSGIVGSQGIVGPDWAAAPYYDARSPSQAVTLVTDQQLVGYDEVTGMCQGAHPLVEGIIGRYLPVPPEVPFDTLCSDPLRYAAAVDPMAWDGTAFAAELQARVIAPGQHAIELLETWPYLTRLYTTISPGEMTLDPMFHLTPDQPDRTDLTQIGTRNVFCDGDVSFSLPDGTLVALETFSPWPDIAPDQMPWAETIAMIPAAGAPIYDVDNRDLIAQLLDEWNSEHGPARSPTSPSCHGETGGPLTAGTGGDSAGADGTKAGCSCRSGAGEGGVPWWLGLGLLGLRRRRRSA